MNKINKYLHNTLTKFIVLCVLIVTCGATLRAQDVAIRYQGQVITSRGLPASNQNVAVCTQPAVTSTTPCSPLATLGTSTSSSTGGTNPLPVCTSPGVPTSGCFDSNGNFFFYAASGKYTVQIYGPQIGTPFVMPDQNLQCIPSGNCTFSGTETFSGQILVKNLESIRFADQFPGADFGAKINAADADLGIGAGLAGEIWVLTPGGNTISTPIVLHSGHVLRFIQGGNWGFTAGITLEQGCGIIGSGPTISTATSSTGTVFFHSFNGDFITYSGAASGTGTLGGGLLQNLSLYNTFTGGDLNGNAIKITGTSLSLRANDIVIDRVYVDGNSSLNRWTRGLYINGTPVGGTDGVRNITVMNSRFHSSGTNNEDIRIEDAFNTVIFNVKITNSNNGAQTTGITATGSALNVSSGVQLIGVNTTNFAMDFVTAVDVEGGFYTAITSTANTGSNISLKPGNLSTAYTNNGNPNFNAIYLDPSVAGRTTITGSVSIGGGTTVSRLSRFGVSITPTALGAGPACAEQTFTFSGVAAADHAIGVSFEGTQTATVFIGGVRVTAANTIGITFCNTAGTPTPAAGTYQVETIQ